MNALPNITFLRYFYSAGKNRSITQAAKSNFVTQSAISQGIDKLEKSLGKKLLTNRKNRFELTSEGELLLTKCESIFHLFDELQDLFNEKEGIYRGTCTFATSHSFAISLLPKYYKQVFDLHPAIEPILRLGHSGIVRDWVSRGEVEFGLILEREHDKNNFKTHTILQGTYGVYQPKKPLKASKGKLIVSEDANEDKILINYLNQQKLITSPVIEVLSWEVIANMIHEGLGIGIMPDYVAQKHNLALVPIPIPPIPYRIIAISSQRKELSRNSNMFIDLMSARQH